MPGTRKLGRATAHRKAMLRGMVTYLLENGSIETTLTRAKEVRSLTEKMITLGKKNTLATRRAALSFITKEDVVKKLFDVIAPKYANRNGGYTAIYKLGPRRGDAAEMAIIKLVEDPAEEKKEEKKSAAKKAPAKKKAAPKASEEEVKAETEEKPIAEAKAETKAKAPAKKTAKAASASKTTKTASATKTKKTAAADKAETEAKAEVEPKAETEVKAEAEESKEASAE